MRRRGAAFHLVLPVWNRCQTVRPSHRRLSAFRGLRFDLSKTGPLSELICPPFDIIAPSQQRALYRRHRHNSVRLELAMPSEHFSAHAAAARTLRRWLSQGILEHDGTPAVYVHENRLLLDGKWRARLGFFCAVRAEQDSGFVLPHENTLEGPKKDREGLLRACGVQTSPVWAIYRRRGMSAREILKKHTLRRPAAAARFEGESHRLWRVAGEDDREEILALAQRAQLVIADGHHRYAAAVSVAEQRRRTFRDAPGDAALNYVLMLLTEASDEGLVVLASHRLLKLMPHELSRLETLARGSFAVQEFRSVAGLAPELAQEEPGKASLGLCLGGKRFLLLRCPQGNRKAGVEAAQSLLVQPLLRPGEVEQRVHYTRELGEAVRRVGRGEFQASILLNPTPVQRILESSLAGQRMPWKSTYFYPKVPAGLVMFASASPQPVETAAMPG